MPPVKLQGKKERCLVILDSAEVFETPLELDRIRCKASLPAQLRSFIDSTTRENSVVIISSRLATTSIANTPSDQEEYTYHLRGLGVLDSVKLRHELAGSGLESFANLCIDIYALLEKHLSGLLVASVGSGAESVPISATLCVDICTLLQQHL